MSRARLSTTAALIVSLVGSQLSGTLYASEPDPSTTPATSVEQLHYAFTDDLLDARAPVNLSSTRTWQTSLSFAPADSVSAAQRRGGYRGGGGRGRNDGAAAAVVIGTIAAIAGGAVLVYANRPECSTNERANGCGYGSKVLGGAVLSAGVISLVAGALVWR